MPAGVPLPTVMVMVELPEPGGGRVCGLKLTPVPEGAPEEESAMELLKPPMRVDVMVEVPWLPCAMVTKEGDAERVKLPWVTVRVTVVFCWISPPVPVTVMG